MYYREQEFYSIIERLYNSTILKCKKCNNGFIEKKIKDIESSIYSDPLKCDCFKVYEKCKSYIISGIPREFWDAKNKDLQIEPDNKKTIQKYIDNIEKMYLKGLGILFIGSKLGLGEPNSGSGKTISSIKILENAAEMKKNVHYITMNSFFHFLYRTMSDDINNNKEHYLNLIDEINSVDFLVIDEIGKIKKSDYVYYCFEDMIRKRAAQLLVTILITNMSEKELEDFVGPSLMDILKTTMIKLRLESKSYREKKFLDIKQNLNIGG